MEKVKDSFVFEDILSLSEKGKREKSLRWEWRENDDGTFTFNLILFSIIPMKLVPDWYCSSKVHYQVVSITCRGI